MGNPQPHRWSQTGNPTRCKVGEQTGRSPESQWLQSLEMKSALSRATRGNGERRFRRNRLRPWRRHYPAAAGSDDARNLTTISELSLGFASDHPK